MKILSCFDGMSCGQIALNRAGIPVEKYYAAEIDKYAIQITQKNFPDTIQLGDITKWREWDIEKPDMIIAGSPCQGFSFAGKQLNFDDPRSALFFVFVDILKHYKPKYFLLENVVMKKEYIHVISETLGEAYPGFSTHSEMFSPPRIDPIKINSALVSAQNRQRLYWTNIPGIEQPKDRGILLRDIIEPEPEEKYNLSKGEINYMQKGNNKWGQAGDCRLDNYAMDSEKKSFNVLRIETKGRTVELSADAETPFMLQETRTEEVLILGGAFRGRNPKNPSDRTTGSPTEQRLEINKTGKSNTLTSVQKDNVIVRQSEKAEARRVANRKNLDGKGNCLQASSWKGEAANGTTIIPVITIKNHKSKNGLECVGGLNKNKQWLDDGKNLQRNFSQGERIYSTEGKSPTLSANSGGTAGVGSALISGPLCKQIGKADLNGHDYVKRVYSPEGKSPNLCTGTGGNHEPKISEDNITWRKLTPLECERLQTVDDNYTEGVSNTQRYRMLGNGWTVEVIRHIFSYIRPELT